MKSHSHPFPHFPALITGPSLDIPPTPLIGPSLAYVFLWMLDAGSNSDYGNYLRLLCVIYSMDDRPLRDNRSCYLGQLSFQIPIPILLVRNPT